MVPAFAGTSLWRVFQVNSQTALTITANASAAEARLPISDSRGQSDIGYIHHLMLSARHFDAI